jgi:glycogen synthase
MKVAIVTTAGITNQFKSWPEYVQAKALVDRGHQVVAYTYYDPRSKLLASREEVIDGIQVKRVRRRTWVSWDLFQALMFGDRPDVAHVFHWSNSLAFEAVQLFKRRHVPVVVSPVGPFHDPYLVEDRDRPYEGRIKYDEIVLTLPQLAKALARRNGRRRSVRNYFTHAPFVLADRVMALSEHEREVLERLGVSKRRLRVIPLSVDPALQRMELTRPQESRFSRPVILFIGQLKYRKGFDVLAEAMPAIIGRFPEASIVVVSHSPVHRDTLLQIVAGNGTAANLHLLTGVSDEEKARLYLEADLLVLPTRYEGFGLPLVEAMAVGCPVISSDLPVVDEIVENGVNGVLVPRDDPAALAEGIIDLLVNRAKREAMVRAARRTIADKFGIDLYTERLLELYREAGR